MKKKLFKITTRFLILNFLFFIFTSPIVVLFGPFANLKRAAVGAIMTTQHSYFLTWLLSPAQITAIIGETFPVPAQRQKLFHFQKPVHDLIKLQEIKGARFQGYLLEVSDPGRVKVATARDLRDKGEPTSTIAINHNAVAAVNAGGFSDPQGTGTGRLPYGVIIHEKKLLAGSDLKGPVQLVGLTGQGVLVAGNYPVAEMKKVGVAEGVSFGPPLIINGQKMITRGDGGWGIAPRTAIGQRRDGTILLLVIDGRQPGYSLGATLLDVQNVLYEQGAYVAANLDGGSSTTMYYDGKVINKPCDLLGERMVPTAFIVQ